MKDRIEDVKKIRDIISDARLTAYQDGKAGVIAFRIGNMEYEEQICQLFEPKPSEPWDREQTIFEDGKKTGIREVVAILKNWRRCDTNPEAFSLIYPDFKEYPVAGVIDRGNIINYLEAKLKEWGIE